MNGKRKPCRVFKVNNDGYCLQLDRKLFWWMFMIYITLGCTSRLCLSNRLEVHEIMSYKLKVHWEKNFLIGIYWKRTVIRPMVFMEYCLSDMLSKPQDFANKEHTTFASIIKLSGEWKKLDHCPPFMSFRYIGIHWIAVTQPVITDHAWQIRLIGKRDTLACSNESNGFPEWKTICSNTWYLVWNTT